MATSLARRYPLWTKVLYGFGWTSFRVLFTVLCRVKITGKDNEIRSGRVIFAPNHISGVDIPLVGSSISRPMTFLAKKELFRNRFIGWLIRSVHAQAVDRHGYARGALDAMRQALERDEAVIVFPEGTRRKDGTLGEAKIGVGMLSVWTNAPVVPVYVRGTRDIWGALFFRSRFRVALGPAVFPPAVTTPQERKEAYQTVTDEVMARISSLKETVDKQ